MVYVFYVQPGEMMTFDHEISIMQSVKDLKEKIVQKCSIPVDSQVLLINGGECLDPDRNLCSYAAGTDNNPIFLFSMNFDITRIEQLPSSTFDDNDLRRRLKECSDLPATLTTVSRRSQLAQDFHEAAKRQLTFCEGLVHDQHMQQQGWAAVIANLEDIMTAFKKRWELFSNNYRDFKEKKDLYKEYLKNFPDDKLKLQNIPVLEPLIEAEIELKNAAQVGRSGSTSQETSSIQESKSEKEPSQSEDQSEIKVTLKNINLFEWIIASDTTINSLDDIHQACREFIGKVEVDIMPELQLKVNEVMMNNERKGIKEIDGLGTRLYHLEEILAKFRKYVQHQSDMAQSFQQNQQRASNLRDLSILEDLCATHKQQLEYIREHHYKIMEDRQKILKTKYELCKSLAARLRWVEITEEKIYSLDSTIVYINEAMTRTKRNLKIFQQIHETPQIYTTALAEVVRRKQFSQTFLLWSSEVACHQLAIHNDEITRRKDFGAQFNDHFLSDLFPGMEDVPPAFAIEAPSVFDAMLPAISEEDVERLRSQLPEYADYLTVPDLSTYANFFASKLETRDKTDETQAVEEKLMQAVSDVGLASNLDRNLLKGAGSEPSLATAHCTPHLKDLDKGCESETDTEEFEKVGQSPLELNFAKDPIPTVTALRPGTQDASTLTEDNLEITKSEHERLKSHLISMGIFAKQITSQLKEELDSLKTQVKHDQSAMNQCYESLSTSWDTLVMERDNQEKQIMEDLQKNHEEHVNLIKRMEDDNAMRMEELETDKVMLESDILRTYSEINDLQERIIDMDEQNKLKLAHLEQLLVSKDLEMEKVVKEVTERLKKEHRAEIDNIKSRFRLMTTDRSPSTTSLDKSGDFASLPTHSTLLMQMTENFELDKQSAIEQVMDNERMRYERILEEKIKEVERRIAEEKDQAVEDLLRRVCDDKDKQIDLLREREKNLNLECIKYKTTIQQLTEFELEDTKEDFEKKYNSLLSENQMLREELEKVKKDKVDLEALTASVAVDGRTDMATSPLRQRTDMSASDIPSLRPRKISIDSCNAGDLVLVLWDANHESFKIVQESKSPKQHLYFLHTDSLDGLGLSAAHGKPNKVYCSGEVVDKEYCHARKSENRYRVPRGTKFFRVKVKPLPGPTSTATSLYHARPSTSSAAMSQSQAASVLLLQSQTIAEEAAVAPIPPSPPIAGAVMSDSVTAPPDDDERNFAVDSGIVDNIDQGTDVDSSCDTDR